MAIISVELLESPLQIIDGIPQYVQIETNIPSTVFYTLDGTDPDTNSLVAVGPVILPTDQGAVILKVFATNGTDESPILSWEFSPDLSKARRAQDRVDVDFSGDCDACGSGPRQGPNQFWRNTTGVIVDDSVNPREATGFDAGKHPDGYVTPPIDQYQWVFSETNSVGEMGRGIGTLPQTVISIEPIRDNSPPQASNANSKFFNAKARVIYQDYNERDPLEPQNINRPSFTLEETDYVHAGGLLLTSPDTPAATGYAQKSFFNPNTGEITYYYYDNKMLRWIISKEKFNPDNENIGNLANTVKPNGRGTGSRYVYKWHPFRGRVLP